MNKCLLITYVTVISLTRSSCKFQIAYKQGCEQEPGEYNYPATQTPGYQSQRKLDPLKDVSSLKSSQSHNAIILQYLVNM